MADVNGAKDIIRQPKTSSTKPAIGNESPMPATRSPTMVTNRLHTTLRSMSPLQKLIQLYLQELQQQQQTDFSPAHIRLHNNKFMWQHLPKSKKSLALHFDPLSGHKLQLPLQYQPEYHSTLLTVRQPRLAALQHLPLLQQQNQNQLLQLATPQEAQLTKSYDHLTNDLDNVYNVDMD
ncbi:hypothetical protein EVAR_70858_1 [Eumeta japonica]|uniref:Uncharacterized protein n=1 Tax=Eumeta variegata TaxID=151549 RepID=A0A4C1T3Y1_EUMVA|nr:hypothetical protein EVAR_70858_1 [Eumeta japonica]